MFNIQRIAVFVLTICCVLNSATGFSSIHPHRCNKWYSLLNQPFESFTFIYTSLSSKDYAVETSDVVDEVTVRSKLRKVTGFSLTALRATMRTATGISLTALYVSALAVSGFWIRQTMRIILDIFPTWARYFVQPFLVLYYVPLFMLRNITAPKRRERKEAHDTLVESWKQAVAIAEHSSSYWPIHINEDGEIERVVENIDVNDAIAQAVEISLEKVLER